MTHTRKEQEDFERTRFVSLQQLRDTQNERAKREKEKVDRNNTFFFAI